MRTESCEGNDRCFLVSELGTAGSHQISGTFLSWLLKQRCLSLGGGVLSAVNIQTLILIKSWHSVCMAYFPGKDS